MKKESKRSKYDRHLEELDRKSNSVLKKRVILVSLLLGSGALGFYSASQFSTSTSDSGRHMGKVQVVKENAIMNQSPRSLVEEKILSNESHKEEAIKEIIEEEKAKIKEEKEVETQKEKKEEKETEVLETTTDNNVSEETSSSLSSKPIYGVSSHTFTKPSSTVRSSTVSVPKEEVKSPKIVKIIAKTSPKKETPKERVSSPTPKVKEVKEEMAKEEKKEPKKVVKEQAKATEKVAEKKTMPKVKSYSQPQFPGGKKALRKFLMRNVKYPSLATERKIEGKVSVSVTIDKNGNISNSKVIEGIGGGCDEQVLKAVKKMPKWQPAVLNGEKIDKTYRISFRFALPD